MIVDKYPECKQKQGERRFWAGGYCVDAVGRKEEQIRQYINGAVDILSFAAL